MASSPYRLKFLGVTLLVTATVTGDVAGEFETEVEKITTENGDDIGELVACAGVMKNATTIQSMDDAIERALRDKLIGELP